MVDIINQTKVKNSYTDKWGTPPTFYQKLHEEFFFDDFDPCPLNWKEGDPDGLEIEWAETTFVNPPFSKINLWIQKADKEWRKGKTVVMIMNLKTHTRAFHELVLKNPVEIRFLQGKINFIHPDGKKSTNPFGNMLLIWRKEMSPPKTKRFIV
jgi:hypothetical protein